MPAFYFDARRCVAEASFALTMPACLLELGVEAASAMLEAEVERQQAEAREYVKAKGWKVAGARRGAERVAVPRGQLARAGHARAAHRGRARADRGARRRDRRARAARADHRAAKARWIAGERDVVFPAGTFWMRVHHGARVSPFS